MKKFWITAVSLMAAVSLAACGASAPVASSSSASSEVVSSEAVSSEAVSSEPAPEEPSAGSGRLEQMSSPRYVGVVDDFAVNDAGETVLIMKPSHGITANGILNVTLTKDTAYTVEKNAIANGAELEIFYVLNEQKEAVAVQINEAAEIPADGTGIPDFSMEESVSYDGVVLDIYFDPSNPKEGSIEMTDFDGQTPYVFHFYEETVVENIDLNEIKPQTKLHVEHSPISTRSLPPQSNAFSISPYQPDAQ